MSVPPEGDPIPQIQYQSSQSNGQTEQKVQEIRNYLRTFCHHHQNTWSQFIAWVKYPHISVSTEHGPGNLPTYHQCITGSRRVRGSGTRLSTMFKESFNIKRAMLMSSGPPLHRINPDRRYGSPPRTSSYASPAGS